MWLLLLALFTIGCKAQSFILRTDRCLTFGTKLPGFCCNTASRNTTCSGPTYNCEVYANNTLKINNKIPLGSNLYEDTTYDEDYPNSIWPIGRFLGIMEKSYTRLNQKVSLGCKAGKYDVTDPTPRVFGVDGIVLNTGAQLQCVAGPSNAVWELVIPALDCATPCGPFTSSILNVAPGSCGTKSVNFQKTCQPGCVQGYTPSSTTATCNTQGQWSSSGTCLKQCRAIDLVLPVGVVNSSCAGTYNSSQTCQLACGTSRTLTQGTLTATCNNGIWQTTAVCPRSCGDFVPRSAVYNFQNRAFSTLQPSGTTITLTCRTEIIRVLLSDITLIYTPCDSGSRRGTQYCEELPDPWPQSGCISLCTRENCGRIGPTPTVTCVDGTWSCPTGLGCGSPYRIVDNCINIQTNACNASCPVAALPSPNSNMNTATCPGTTTVATGGVCNRTCIGTTSPRATYSCVNGAWVDPGISCQPNCLTSALPALPSSNAGTCSVPNIARNGICARTCRADNTQREYICQDDGQWATPVGSANTGPCPCLASDLPPLPFSSAGSCTGNFVSGRSCTRTCSSGSTQSGNITYVCNAGTWTTPTGYCARSCDRSVITNLISNENNGNCSQTTAGATSCALTCRSGFTSFGPGSFVNGLLFCCSCTKATTGNWTHAGFNQGGQLVLNSVTANCRS
jgi:hypothetical protein